MNVEGNDEKVLQRDEQNRRQREQNETKNNTLTHTQFRNLKKEMGKDKRGQ